MKLHVNFSALLSSVNIMGANKRKFSLDSMLPDLEEIDVQLKKGLSVDISDITILDNGLLSYKGRQVLLYIKDHGWNVIAAINNGSSGKKYHVSYCKTLEEMKSKGRYERYVANNDIDGFFLIDGKNQDTQKYTEGKAELKVCKNCLKHLNYNQYKEKSSLDHVFRDFSLKEFFINYQTFFKHQPKYKASEIKSAYTDDWPEISRGYKESVKWACEGCHLKLKKHPKLLQIHHINGVKQDNSGLNLKALCLECHAQEPNHHHMKISVDQKTLFTIIRNNQSIDSV